MTKKNTMIKIFSLNTWIPVFAGMTAFIASSLISPAPAQEPPLIFMTQEELAPYAKTIRRIENYLSGISTIVADFTQAAPDGSISTGKFFLQRPGKMRWQYHPPTPVLMVADGKEFIYYDYELDQISRISLDSTLIGFLAQERIRFDNGQVGIRDFSEQANVIRITVAQREKAKEGELTLEFSTSPMVIRNMVVRDAAGQITSVALNNARFGVKMDPKLFLFKEPRNRLKRT